VQFNEGLFEPVFLAEWLNCLFSSTNQICGTLVEEKKPFQCAEHWNGLK